MTSSQSSTSSLPPALIRQFTLSTEELKALCHDIALEMETGLAESGKILKMIPTFVNFRPDRAAISGTYFALDVGGTNCRIWCFHFTKDTVDATSKITEIHPELKKTDGTAFFTYLAKFIQGFIQETELADPKFKARVAGVHSANPTDALRLGFTFSFPVDQTALAAGKAVAWSKGFSVSGVLGQDVVQMLQDALVDCQLNIKITALLNDTVGTLVAHVYAKSNTCVGVILGTGTNAAYFEKTNKIRKTNKEARNSVSSTAATKTATSASSSFTATSSTSSSQGRPSEMAINTEWGAYANRQLLHFVDAYDGVLDRQSENKGHQIFEKMMSGRYIGEIVRLVLSQLTRDGVLFQGKSHPFIDPPTESSPKFDTKAMSFIESDKSTDYKEIHIYFATATSPATPTVAASDCRVILDVCRLVSTRAARLTAAATAAILSRCDVASPAGVTVAIDGSLYEKYPDFGPRVEHALADLLGVPVGANAGAKVTLELAGGGSAMGAALVAATAPL